MTSIECPQCHTVHQGDVSGRAAADFCPQCDYPLFFAPESAVEDGPGDAFVPAAEAATATANVATGPPPAVVDDEEQRICTACLAANPLEAVFCGRCGHALDADPGPLYGPDTLAMPAPASSSSAALVLSLLALLIAMIALVLAAFA